MCLQAGPALGFDPPGRVSVAAAGRRRRLGPHRFPPSGGTRRSTSCSCPILTRRRTPPSPRAAAGGVARVGHDARRLRRLARLLARLPAARRRRRCDAARLPARRGRRPDPRRRAGLRTAAPGPRRPGRPAGRRRPRRRPEVVLDGRSLSRRDRSGPRYRPPSWGRRAIFWWWAVGRPARPRPSGGRPPGCRSCCATRRPSPGTRPAATASPPRRCGSSSGSGSTRRRSPGGSPSRGGAPLPERPRRRPAAPGRRPVRRRRPPRGARRRPARRRRPPGRRDPPRGGALESLREPGKAARVEPSAPAETSSRARYVVAADGMYSAVRRLTGGAGVHLGEWHAFRQYFTGVADRRLWVIFEPDLLPGYAWVFPVAGGRANVGFGLPRRPGDLRAAHGRPVARPPGAAGAAGTARRRRTRGPPPGLAHPGRPRPAPRCPPAGSLFVGDAAGATDPMTGEGIGQALLTGILAAEAVAAAGPDPAAVGRRYRPPCTTTSPPTSASPPPSAPMLRSPARRPGGRAGRRPHAPGRGGTSPAGCSRTIPGPWSSRRPAGRRGAFTGPGRLPGGLITAARRAAERSVLCRCGGRRAPRRGPLPRNASWTSVPTAPPCPGRR